MLAISGLVTHYGQIQALRGIDLQINAGEIVALIGANGAGKSTLLMTIFGQPPASGGTILFRGDDITHAPTHLVARSGVAQVPEGRHIFPRMTVYENLQLGATCSAGDHFERDLERVFALFPILRERSGQRGGTLSGGEQQMLAIARALMGRPRLLLLDEPSLGLAPKVVAQIFEVIREINNQGTTVFLVEQNAYHALRLAHRAYVIATGEIVTTGTGRDLLNDPDVRAAYLEGAPAG